MKAVTLALTLVLLAPAVAPPADQPPGEPKGPANVEPPRRGMTAAEVRDKFGGPKRLARQIFYRRHLEVWTYDPPHNFQVEFDCPRGDDPVVLSVRLLGAPPEIKPGS